MCPANSCWILIDRLCTSCLFRRSIYRNDLCWRIEVVHNLTWLSSMTMKRTLSSSSRREAGPGVHQRPHFRPSALSLPGSARRASAFRRQAVHKPREGHLDRSDPPVRARGEPRSPGLSQGLPGRRGWQLLQNTVMRCCTSRDVRGALQVVHGRPARPYTLCSFWNDPQPPSAVR